MLYRVFPVLFCIITIFGVQFWVSDGYTGFGSMNQPHTSIIYVTGVWESSGESCSIVSRCGNIYVCNHQEWGAGHPNALNDINGTPNYVVGTGMSSPFYDEPILLPPTPPGVYDLIADGNMNGTYESGSDYLVSNLVLHYGGDVPEWMETRVSEIKARAVQDTLGLHPCERTVQYLNATSLMFSSFSMFTNIVSGNIVGAVVDGLSIAGVSTDYNSAVLSIGKDLLMSVANAAKQAARGIAADPPDLLHFREFYAPISNGTYSLPADDVHSTALFHAVNWLGKHADFQFAVLASMERYQGARDEGELNWARFQAKQLRDFSEESKSVVDSTCAALYRLAFVWDSLGVCPELASIAPDFTTIQTRLASTGFTSEEEQRFRGLSMNDEEIDTLRENLINVETEQFTGMTGGEMLRMAADSILLTKVALDSLIYFGNEMAESLTTGSLGQTDYEPNPELNGPYAGFVGSPVTFSAAGTSGGSGLSYYWDIDEDGIFDDLTGVSPSFTYTDAGVYVVGLRVQNSWGRLSYGWTTVSIGIANRSPVFISFAPDSSYIPLERTGASVGQSFIASFTDPEDDDVTALWLLDSTEVGTGTTYDFSTTDTGFYRLECVISDDYSGNLDNCCLWLIHVYQPSGPTIDISLSADSRLFDIAERKQRVASQDSQRIGVTNNSSMSVDLGLEMGTIPGFTVAAGDYDFDDTLYFYSTLSMQAIFDLSTVAPAVSSFSTYIDTSIIYADDGVFGTAGYNMGSGGFASLWFCLKAPNFFIDDSLTIPIILRARESIH